MAIQRANNSITWLILVVSFAFGYLFYSQTIKPGQLPVNPPPVGAQSDFQRFETLTIDYSVLEDPRFEALRTFGENPVSTSAPGKRDIFAPF